MGSDGAVHFGNSSHYFSMGTGTDHPSMSGLNVYDTGGEGLVFRNSVGTQFLSIGKGTYGATIHSSNGNDILLKPQVGYHAIVGQDDNADGYITV